MADDTDLLADIEPEGTHGTTLTAMASPRGHYRAPSFVNLQALPHQLVQVRLVAEVVAVIGSINIVLGEVDR